MLKVAIALMVTIIMTKLSMDDDNDKADGGDDDGADDAKDGVLGWE